MLNYRTGKTAIDLKDYGWRERPHPTGGELGRIVRVYRGECDVATTSGVVRALSDSQRAQSELAPTTGDWVLLTDDRELGVLVKSVLPRKNSLSRRSSSDDGREQVLVSNIDTVMIVHGLDRPLPPGRLERLLVLAWDSGAEVVVVLTKADTDAVRQADSRLLTIRAVSPSTPVLLVGGRQGLKEVSSWIGPGRTAALIGESGAGKSTLVNSLLGENRLATADVRESDSKGRHTTIGREIVHLPDGGLIIDMPGIRAVGLLDSEEALARVFGDIGDLAVGCQYSDCTHESEPGCAVILAIEDGLVDRRRVDRYRSLSEEVMDQRRREVKRSRQVKKDRR